MLKGILNDARHDNSFYWKWGLVFAILGLLLDIVPFMVMGGLLLTLAIWTELDNNNVDEAIWNREKIDEQTAEDQQGGPGTSPR